MRIIPGFLLALAVVSFSAASACATTVGFTEGARPLVAGTTAVADNADDSLPGFDLGALSASGLTTINLFGRIETAHDIYQFTTTSPFRVDFIFGGYNLQAGGYVSASGFVADPSGGTNTSDFLLRITAPGNTPLGEMIYTTPYTSGNSFIFSATAPGTYRFRINGADDGVVTDSVAGDPAYYDIRIEVTPVPAALPIFATGLSIGLGVLGWRNRRQRATPAI